MKTGFIGCGNMGKAIIRGLIASGASPEDIIVYDKDEEALAVFANETGIIASESNIMVVNEAGIIILAVTPGVLGDIISGIKDEIGTERILVSIAAGKTLSFIEKYAGSDKKIVRVMPNTPALVGAGVTGYCCNENVTDGEAEQVSSILSAFSDAYRVSEDLMDVVTAIGGSAPAYVYMFIEALADGAVLDGMSRDLAYKFAAKCVYGSAKMVMESGLHPGQLKDMVCSPGGTTIEGVLSLEQDAFRSAVAEAVHCAYVRSAEISSEDE